MLYVHISGASDLTVSFGDPCSDHCDARAMVATLNSSHILHPNRQQNIHYLGGGGGGGGGQIEINQKFLIAWYFENTTFYKVVVIILMSGPDNPNGEFIRHESEGWGFESPSGRDIFCLKNFDTFTRTSVDVSKINAVARAYLTYQMLTLL